MYISNTNIFTDKTEIVAFMQRFSFATIITSKNNIPTATHLPFLINYKDEKIILTSHFAKANNHYKDIENNNVLVIFTEPHAYISPNNYEKELNVPTWNYMAVHAYGQGGIISTSEKVISLIENTIVNYEAEYLQQWNKLPYEYKMNLLKGIVAFEIIVTDLQAKKKLSQNKTQNEQLNIINSLAKSNNTNENLIADYMTKNIK